MFKAFHMCYPCRIHQGRLFIITLILQKCGRNNNGSPKTTEWAFSQVKFQLRIDSGIPKSETTHYILHKVAMGPWTCHTVAACPQWQLREKALPSSILGWDCNSKEEWCSPWTFVAIFETQFKQTLPVSLKATGLERCTSFQQGTVSHKYGDQDS